MGSGRHGTGRPGHAAGLGRPDGGSIRGDVPRPSDQCRLPLYRITDRRITDRRITDRRITGCRITGA
ncbi:hypothetical protein TPA0908_50230 [Micromonospora sp. AKA38]|nr:hypothetical protein TPA0908_50230 [Micromonospora sp. AKA38]